jgi:phospholipid-binding lipoprotein MlaA
MTSLLAADKRASLFSTEEIITGDAYLFRRDAYNQRREHLIKNGEVEDAFLDDEE